LSHKRNGQYNDKLKEIRPYIDFNFNLNEKLTPAQKSKITRYHKAIVEIKRHSNQIYRPRRKDHLKTAQKYGNHPAGHPGIKVAFIPAGKEKIKITFKRNGELTAKSKHVNTRYFEFDQQRLAEMPDTEIARLLKERPNARAFNIQTGIHEIKRPTNRVEIGEKIHRLINQYDDDKKNNHYANWMHGIKTHEFKNQAGFRALRKEMEEANAQTRASNKLLRGRNKRKANKLKRKRK